MACGVHVGVSNDGGEKAATMVVAVAAAAGRGGAKAPSEDPIKVLNKIYCFEKCLLDLDPIDLYAYQ
jgi:hypothetical protein